jgi:hypothetical protein
MPDCKNLHSISYQILLWTLLGYVLMYSRLSLFFVYTIVFFVATMMQHKTDSRTQIPYAEFLTQ